MKSKICTILIIILLLLCVGCKHKHKDKNHDCLCDKCGIELTHQYENGVCKICGKVQNTTPTPTSLTLDKTFVLLSAESADEDVTSEFLIYSVEFHLDLSMEVKIYHNGYLEKRESTYQYIGSIITETYQDKSYQYTIFGNQLMTSYDDLGDEITIILKLEEDEEVLMEVDFESLLFGEPLTATKKYNYCPAIIYDHDDEGRDIMHIWYCCNRDSGVIMDYIGYRVGTKQDNGKWRFTDEVIALAPTPNTWDARHTCDPSVVKGEFKLGDETYSYLMAYLGCTTEDYQKNETGIAVAKTPAGPWVKIDAVNPIVPWYDDGNYDTEEAKYQSYKGTSSIYWGTGMPSLVSTNQKGEVLMFYSSTYRGIGVRRIDLSDLASPVVKYTVSLTHRGVVNSQNQNCRIGIPDFAYDSVNKRFYVTAVTNEKNPADVTLTRVNSHSMVCYIENVDSLATLANLIQSGDYQWKVLGYIGPNETGWERNHNPGIVKNEYGIIPDASHIQVIVSTGHNSWAMENIFTYRLFGWTFDVS